MSNKLNSYIIYTLLVFSIISVSYSKDLINTDFNYKVGVGFNHSSVSSYFDNNGNLNSKYPKTRTITFDNDGTDSSFTVDGFVNIDYIEFHNNYFSEFKLSDNLIGSLGLDLAYFSTDNSYSFEDTLRDENGNIKLDNFNRELVQNVNIDDFSSSMFRLMYLRPSLQYYLINDKDNILSFKVGAQIPFGFEERKLNNDSTFLGDGYIQLNGNIDYRVIYKTIELQLGAGYIKRTEIYNDLANINLTIFLTKIDDAYFYFRSDYNSGIGIEDDDEFIINEFPYSESFLNSTFGLNVFFEEFELQFDYTFVPIGVNYWLQNRVNASFHYFIK